MEVNFPSKLWAIVVWLVANNGIEIPMCLSIVEKNKAQAIKNAEEAVLEIRAKFKHSNVLDYIILVPLTFSKLHPLKKEYWEMPEIRIKEVDRSTSLIKSLVNPDFYYFLVTPTRFKDKGNRIFPTAAFAFKREDEEMLGEMMKASDHSVCPEAKNAAVYEPSEPFSYDLVKKKEFVNEEYLSN